MCFVETALDQYGQEAPKRCLVRAWTFGADPLEHSPERRSSICRTVVSGFQFVQSGRHLLRDCRVRHGPQEVEGPAAALNTEVCCLRHVGPPHCHLPWYNEC